MPRCSIVLLTGFGNVNLSRPTRSPVISRPLVGELSQGEVDERAHMTGYRPLGHDKGHRNAVVLGSGTRDDVSAPVVDDGAHRQHRDTCAGRDQLQLLLHTGGASGVGVQDGLCHQVRDGDRLPVREPVTHR